MPSVRLFVGNLPYQATEDDLRTHFAQVGEPTQIVRPLDRETGRARGFAFVEYAERAPAEEAIKRFDGQLFMGRPLAVSEARAREDRGPSTGPRPWRLRSAADRVVPAAASARRVPAVADSVGLPGPAAGSVVAADSAGPDPVKVARPARRAAATSVPPRRPRARRARSPGSRRTRTARAGRFRPSSPAGCTTSMMCRRKKKART